MFFLLMKVSRPGKATAHVTVNKNTKKLKTKTVKYRSVNSLTH